MPVRERRFVLFIEALLFSVAAALLDAGAASARHRARLDPSEPIFTQRSFVEKDVEFAVGWEKGSDGDELEIAPGLIVVFNERFQFDLEVPSGLQIPDEGATVGNLGDVAAGAQVLLCCRPDQLLDYLSVRLDVAAPTGSRSKDIGGTGSWGMSLLPGRLFTIVERLPDLFVQAQFSYAEQIRAEQSAIETAADLGVPVTREKEVDWNLAFVQQYAGGRFRPVFEVLGTSIVEAVPGSKGTIVELAAGLWTAPFPDEHWLSPVSLGLGWKWPVTHRKESQVAALFIVEWSFGR